MRRKASFSLTIFVLVAFGTSFQLNAQRRGIVPPPIRASAPNVVAETPEIKRRVEAFNTVWNTIYFYYFDPTFNDLNWLEMRSQFEPRIRKAKTDAEAHDILEEMIGKLKVSHLAIIPPDVYAAIENAKNRAKEREEVRARNASDDPIADEDLDDMPDFDDPLAQYGIGADLRIIDNSFVITRLDSNSAAEYAGLKLGYVIDSINDVSMADLLGRVKLLYPGDERVKRFLPLEIVSEFLNGDKDSRVEIGFRDESNKAGTLSIRRERLRTESVAVGGNLPDSQLQFESRELSENVGYVRFNNFSLPVIERFCNSLSDFREKKAIVIDLRGNLGGVIGVTVGLSGMLSRDPIKIGTAIYRYGPEALASQPKAKSYNGKIVVLVDELSVSAAEMFASALQDSKRAVIVGERTAGESLPSISVGLATGATLLYPIANFKTASGKLLEGYGVTPDQTVRLDRPSLLKGEDPQLAAALSLIANDRSDTGQNRRGIEFKVPVAQGTGGFGAAPPPPPAPVAKASGPTSKAPAKVPPSSTARRVKESKAVALMNKFGEMSGGLENLRAVDSFEMLGQIELLSAGAANTFDFKMYRSGIEKYAEILHSPATGLVKDIRDGKTMHVKADWGIERVMPFLSPVDRFGFIPTLLDAMDTERYAKLLYLGEFERDGRKVELIDGETLQGMTVAIYFDSTTKLLAGYEGPTGGVTFDNFKKVGDVLLPFAINNHGQMNITFDEIKINTKIDPAVFEHKQNCYDRPD
jgi:carboxyl-terminal processing protease